MAKFDSNGSLLFSSYLGGSSAEMAFDVAVDQDHNVYVTGLTSSTASSFPPRQGPPAPQPDHTDGGQTEDVFIAKISADFSRLVYLTFVGGPAAAGTLNPADDEPRAIAVDGTGAVYVGGSTTSASLPPGRWPAYQPTHAPVGGGWDYDGFLVRVSAEGTAYDFATFLGGDKNEWVEDLAVDRDGNVYATGGTGSSNFPKTGNAEQDKIGGTADAFLARFSPDGQTVYASYVGGTKNDKGYAVAVREGPVIPGLGFQPGFGGGNLDGFLVGFDLPDSTPRTAFVGGYTAELPGPSPGGSIIILTSTTRWRPQRAYTRDATGQPVAPDPLQPIKAVFQGPTDLDLPTVKVQVTPPAGWSGTYTPALGTVTGYTIEGQTPAAGTKFYAVDWMGPWTYTDAVGTQAMPRGNYALEVSGERRDSDDVIESASYDKVSLVEVRSVKLALPGGSTLTADPEMKWSADEVHAEVRRVERPGGGLRIFPEANVPGETPRDGIAVTVTTDPKIPAEVKVYLKLLDVADPDGTGDPGSAVQDNDGVPVPPPVYVTIPTNTTAAATSFAASHQPGDNYRVVASTSSDWLANVKAYQPSVIGEVRDEADDALPETSHAGPAQLSKMLTVWRTLHLEIDSMQPAPAETETDADERNFIEGDILRIEGREGNARRVYVSPKSPPGMNGLSDGSRDRCSPPARPVGNGRFEAGQLRIGQGDGAQPVNVAANGTDFVDSLSAGFLYINARLRDRSNNSLCTTAVVSTPAGFSGNNGLCTTLFVSNPEGLSSFDLRLGPQCRWDEAIASATTLEIGGVAFEITSASPTRTDGDYQLATVEVKTGGTLPFRLVDDDATTAPFRVNVSLLQDTDDPNTNVFAAAYIRPRILQPGGPEGYADDKTAAFSRNIECYQTGPDTCSVPEAEDTRPRGREDGFWSAPDYWVAYIQGAFQGGEEADEDPAGELATFGLGSVGGRLGALVFTESLQDAEGQDGPCTVSTAPHEIGHLFGLPDTRKLGGVMDPCSRPGDTYFHPEHLRTIRKGMIP